MNKIFITILLSLIAFTVKPQTIEEAKKHIYYQRYESAKQTLLTIIEKGSYTPDTWYWLADIYMKEQKLDSARSTLLDGMAFFTKNNLSKKSFPLIFVGWAHQLLDTGFLKNGRTQMEDILKLTKYKNPDVLLAAARANINSKNGDAVWAIDLLKRAIKRDKKNPLIYSSLGDAYRKLINGSEAIVNYNKALSVDPSFAEAMFKKGLIYKSQKNTEIYIDRFTRAHLIDSNYTPVLYELYYYYFYRDINKAGKMLAAYLRNADPDAQHDYMITDYYYVSQKYNQAINYAKNIIANEGNNTQPRIYKLIAYSYAATGDSATALEKINQYFTKQKNTAVLAKDYELKAQLLEKLGSDKLSSIEWYRKALEAEKEKKERLNYMITLADIQKEAGNREREAVWREKIYTTKEKPTNLDLFNWGVALYSDENYEKADSVFAIYAGKYPDQLHGYLWRARCNALIDTTMEMGLAIPYYKKLTEVASIDKEKNKTALIKAYGYLGAFEGNTRKDYVAALGYFNKILELDPENSEATKYSEILKKWIDEGTKE